MNSHKMDTKKSYLIILMLKKISAMLNKHPLWPLRLDNSLQDIKMDQKG